MASNRLVHCIVENLGGEVMQAAFIGAADIHPRAAAHRFEAFKDFNVFGGIGVAASTERGIEQIGHDPNIAVAFINASWIRWSYRSNILNLGSAMADRIVTTLTEDSEPALPLSALYSR